MRIAACTVIARNYLAQARAWAESVRRQDPELPIAVLVVDEHYGVLWSEPEIFSVVGVAEIGLPRLEAFLFRYEVTELSTAVKPWLLAYVLDRFGADAALFFDPDVLCFESLQGFEPLLADADVIVTPHLRADDRARNEELEATMLLCGTFNLGFIGVRGTERGRAFLAWWGRRLEYDCVHDVANGLFVDQKWVNLAVFGDARLRIVEHPGCNVAYWNLHQRRITRDGDGRYRVDGEPLWFFHFSGYSPFASGRVSKYLEGLRAKDQPVLRPLLADYVTRLARHGFFESVSRPYGLGAFGDGTPIPMLLRRLFLQVDRLDPDRFPYPRAVVDASSFPIWALSQPEPRSWPPIAETMWETQADLTYTFPRAMEAFDGDDGRRYLAWFRAVATARLGVPSSWLEYARRGERRAGHAPRPRMLAGLPRRIAADAVPWVRRALAEDDCRRATTPRELDAALAAVAAAAPAELRSELAGWLASMPLSRVWSWFASRVDAHREHLDLSAPASLTRCLRWMARELPRVGGFGEEDLRLFEDASEADPARAGAWMAVRNIELRLPVKDGARAARGAPTAPEAEDLGVNLVGHYDARSGVGEAARSLVGSVRRAGIRAAIETLPAERSAATEFLDRHDPLRHAISVFNVNADNLLHGWPRRHAEALAATTRIGVWFWEVELFPDGYRPALEHVDELWARSRFLERVFRAATDKPVAYVPIAIAEEPDEPGREDPFGVRTVETVFLAVADGASVLPRKNPEGAIDAFRAARLPFERARLVIKLSNVDEEIVRRLYARAAGANVLVLDESLDRDAQRALLRSADALVSLHRSEGLGLPVAEAIAMGKPVIATDYGGTLDFTHEDDSYLVPHTSVRVGPHGAPYPAEATWAEPDVGAAAEAMRAIAGDGAAAMARALRARAALRREHGEERVARLVAERILEIHRRRAAVRSGAHAAAESPASGEAAP